MASSFQASKQQKMFLLSWTWTKWYTTSKPSLLCIQKSQALLKKLRLIWLSRKTLRVRIVLQILENELFTSSALPRIWRHNRTRRLTKGLLLKTNFNRGQLPELINHRRMILTSSKAIKLFTRTQNHQAPSCEKTKNVSNSAWTKYPSCFKGSKKECQNYKEPGK